MDCYPRRGGRPSADPRVVVLIEQMARENPGWGRTARSEVTDRMLIAGPQHLRAVLDEYAAHYNRHRPHRARDLRPPDSGDHVTVPVTSLATARIRRRKVLGGLIHEYGRAA